MKIRYFPLLLTLLAAGCVKHPWPGGPHPQAPEFLVSKMTVVYQSGNPDPLPGDPGLSLSKEVSEFRYNARYKLASRYVYYVSGDTVNLQFWSRDTFYYDNRHRVTQVDTYVPAQPGVRTRKRFTYSGNDTLPNSEQTWNSGMPEPDSLYFRGTVHFIYKPDTALAISTNHHGQQDTMYYVYEGGNFKRQYSTTGFEEDIYSTYDNAVNVERMMGLSHNLTFFQPLSYVVPPVFSRNNWIGEGPQTRMKTIEYLPGNLVGSYVVTENEPIPATSYNVRFEYFSPND